MKNTRDTSVHLKRPGSLEELESWIDKNVVDRVGQRIGVVVDVYANDDTGAPEWLAVVTRLFGSRLSFVPLEGAYEVDGHIRVAYERLFIKDSPNVEADGRLSEEEETRLYRYYGIPRSGVVTVVEDDEIDMRTADTCGVKGTAETNDVVAPVVSTADASSRSSEGADYS